jgi:ATP-binding cassette subfamily B protein
MTPGGTAAAGPPADEAGDGRNAAEMRRRYSAFDAELTGKALNLQLFRRLLRWVRPYRRQVLASIGCIIASAGLAVMLPVIMGRVVIDTVLRPGQNDASMPDYGLVELTRGAAALLGLEMLAAAALVYVALVALQSLMLYLHRVTLASGSLRALRDLRFDLFASLERKPAAFYDHVSVGRVMTRVTNDIENLFELLTGFGQLAGEFVPFLLALFLMLHISSDLTGFVLLAAPLCAVATFVFRRVMSDVFRRIRNSVSRLNQYMQENLIGLKVVQLSGREALNEQQYGALNRENRQLEFRATNIEVLYGNFNDSLASIATAGIVWYGGGQVVQQEITLGGLVLFNQLIGMMIQPIVAVGEQLNVLFRAMASGERIFQALDWQESTKEPADPVPLPPRLSGRIEFRHARFGYYPDMPVLRDVSFSIEPGHKLAIVGPTGSGKSTIIRLLARFYDFDDGMIFLDGIDVNRIASSDLRRRVGVVLQDFHVFSGSVLENITLNDPAITPERAKLAARLVHAEDFILRLPDGYETVLTERGQNLSQGQRQLLAFARVLAADPEIFVLDEATASIDTGTELLIQDALRVLMANRTAIVIAHRLQTIQECDHILVLQDGVVKEYGTHAELLAARGIYHTLHELQFQDATAPADAPRRAPRAEARGRADEDFDLRDVLEPGS